MRRLLQKFDADVIAAVRRLPKQWRPAMRLVTHLGQPGVVSGILLVTAGRLALGGHRTAALGALVGLAGVYACLALKFAIRRRRPDTYRPRVVHTYSFPSGHAAGGLIAYGYAGVMVAATLAAPADVLLLAGMLGLVAVIGLSRVVVGAHYPTDVLGGWVLGAAILAGVLAWVVPS